MSTMNAEIYDALTAAGAPEAKARAAAVSLVGPGDRLTNLETRIDKVEKRLTNLETRMEKVEERLEKLETRMDKVEARLTSIEMELAVIKSELRWLKWIGGGILTTVLAIAVRIILFPL